jgi:hypothetical protein
VVSAVTWKMFTKRTEDPKLAWLESKLGTSGIAHRRNGFSFHAPIMEVPEERLQDAHRILAPVDDIPDDDPVFVDDAGGCSCGPASDGGEAQCAFCCVDEVVADLKRRVTS